MGCCSSKTLTKQPGSASDVPKPTPEPIQLRKLEGSSQKTKVVTVQTVDGTLGSKVEKVEKYDSNYASHRDSGKILGEESKVVIKDDALSLKKVKQSPTIFVDISPHIERKKQQIYFAVNTPSPQMGRPYSTLSDWQNVVSKNQQYSEEELVGKLLQLRNRNWVLEQIKFLTEQNSNSTSSLDSLLISRRILQLREHFNWLAWALAQFYFFFNGSSQHYQQFQGTGLSAPQSDATQLSANSSTTSQSILGRPTLPKVGSKAWSEGFEYKGVFIRVLPYEDAFYIRNELKALKYTQVELLEIKALAPSSFPQQKDLLHQEILLPLIAGVSCGGFYLYATPLIFLPKSDMLQQKIGKEFVHVRDLIKPSSPQSLSYSPSPMAPDHMELNSSTSTQQVLQPPQIDKLTSKSLLKQMPILKNVTTKNMIPIYDYEQFPSLVINHQPHMFYILFDLYRCIPMVATESTSNLMRIPFSSNEDISFHHLPKLSSDGTHLLDAVDLRKFINVNEQTGTLSGKKLDPAVDSDFDIQADELQNSQYNPVDFDLQKDDDTKVADLYQKLNFTKHGWELLIISRKPKETQTILSLQNENRRATSIFASHDTYLNRDNEVRKRREGPRDNITPMKNNAMDEADQTIELSQQHINLNMPPRHIKSQSRQGLFHRHENSQGGMFDATLNMTGDKVYGNALMSASKYKSDFKQQYSLINHTYSTSIETIFSASIDQVVKVVDKSDKIINSNSLKELMHRKGLNMRFLWVVLAKVRLNQQRELVMIDILLRVMRRIINDEVKFNSIAIVTQQASETMPQMNGSILGGAPHVEEYYQGGGSGSVDTFKEILIFFMNTLLKRKMHKNRLVFEETLQGLFLSRMSIIHLMNNLNLKKEEYIYLESKDILEDIIDAPSKNPSLFINAVSTYFKIDFKTDFLRLLRQDKYVFLGKSQPISKVDIKPMSCRGSIETYFTLKEDSYFILARQIASSLKSQQKVHNNLVRNKVKNETRPNNLLGSSLNRGLTIPENNFIRKDSDQQMSNSYSNKDSFNQDGQTFRVKQQVLLDFRHQKDNNLMTIRKYQNMEAIINESPDFTQNNNNGLNDDVQTHKELQQPHVLDFSNLSKRNNFQPSQVSELVFPCALYKMKTCRLINNEGTHTVLSPLYDMPSLDVVDEWTIVMESLLKDVYTVNGSEQVLLESLVYQALLIYFYKNGESDELFKVLAKIRDLLFTVSFCSPETLILIQVLTGMYFEEKRDQLPVEAEKSYLTAFICIFHLYGDPRGRGNFTLPYSLFLSWKLSLLSLAEDKKLHDSEFAEELFDASLKCMINHKLAFKEQQLQNISGANMQFGGSGPISRSAASSQLPTESVGNNVKEPSMFEVDLEKQELQRLMFDIKKYKNKPFNITQASGMHKSYAGYPNTAQSKQGQAAKNVYVTVNHHYNNNKELKGNQKSSNNFDLVHAESYDLFKSRSHIQGLRKKREGDDEATYNRAYDLELSEIEVDFDDEGKNIFITDNFKTSESTTGTCPFQHWSIYRQQISQILQAHHLTRNSQAQQQYQKEIYREMLQRFLPKDLFFQWLNRYNPMMNQSGIQWSNQMIREYIFCQNQQMINSSSSSVVLSHHNLSHHSLSSISMSMGVGSSVQASSKEKRNIHLGSYSQILGKEVGGISKQDMHGIIFTMGTDSYGQLGLEILTAPGKEQHSINLKVLYPRMVLALKEEMIKEICCGHCHTLAINIHGQVFAWGLNENGQLGLGPDAPSIVRKPVLNPYLQNINKLSAGNEHSVAITKGSDLYIWGGGGLTGLNDLEVRPIPTKMEFFYTQGIKILQAVCGGLHTVVITKEGDVYSWGSTEGGQLGLPESTITELCEGKEQPVLTPQKIPKLVGIQVVQVACGEAHNIAMSKDGKLYGWGMSNYGQLGLGFSSDSFEPGVGMEKSKVHEPQEISGLKGEHRIQKIFCGATFSLFQTEKGDLFGCGMNDLGQLGLDTYMEELLQSKTQNFGLEKVKRGKHQQNSSDVTVPTRVICFQGIALHNIACGENHALAVSGDERNMLWAWGMYRQGQLGLGEVSMKMNPRPVQTLCSSAIQKISCGSMHSLTLIGDSQQISTLSSQYYAGANSFDVLSNYWSCDARSLGGHNNEIVDILEQQNQIQKNSTQNDGLENLKREDEVPYYGEGKIKNPK